MVIGLSGGKECCLNVSSRLWGGALRDDTKNGCEGDYGFPLSSKTNFPNSNSTRNQTKNHYVDVLPANSYLFIYLFIYFIHFICLAVHTKIFV